MVPFGYNQKKYLKEIIIYKFIFLKLSTNI